MVGWSDPECSRHRIGALLLGYYTPKGKLIYPGKGPEAELERLWHRIQPLAIDKIPLVEPPSRGSQVGSPLVLSRVHGFIGSGPKWWWLSPYHRREATHVSDSFCSVNLVVPQTQDDNPQLVYIIGLNRVLTIADQQIESLIISR